MLTNVYFSPETVHSRIALQVWTDMDDQPMFRYPRAGDIVKFSGAGTPDCGLPRARRGETFTVRSVNHANGDVALTDPNGQVVEVTQGGALFFYEEQ